MNSFMKLFQDEVVNTIDSMVGQTPTLELKEEQTLSIVSNIIPSITLVKLTVSGDVDATVMVAIPPNLCASLYDLMMGKEETTDREAVNEDGLDATKEVVSTIFGAISTILPAQNDIPVLSFIVDSIELITNRAVPLDRFDKAYVYELKMDNVSSLLTFIADSKFVACFATEPQTTNTHIPQNPSKSIIDDVMLPVRIRIGSTTMLLQDALNLDIDSVVELDTLPNDQLEILIGDIVIGYGVVVKVDGNYGIQVTSLKEANNA